MKCNEMILESAAFDFVNAADNELDLAQQYFETSFENQDNEMVAYYVRFYNMIQREKNARSETWPLERLRERYYS